MLWAPVLVAMAAIFIVSSQPDVPVPTAVGDKPLHALAYAGLGFLVCRAVSGGLPPRVTVRVAVATFLITVGYGATDEVHQMYVPGRSAEIRDLIADGVGAMGALIACKGWDILGKRRV